MKKSVLSLLALPIMVAACTSEEEVFIEKTNGQYANIPKVEANFSWGADTKMASKWELEENDMVGLAWLGVPKGPEYGVDTLAITGLAYQNHPLYATAGKMLQPKTSIYVGKYFSYLPYDETTKNISRINFTIENQKLIDANMDMNAWNKTAARSIWISPRFTDVTLDGDIYGNNQAGVNETFNVYPRKFSNGVGLYFNYKNNTPKTGNVEIYDVKVSYKKSGDTKSVTKFTYAPTESIAEGGDDAWSTKGFANVVAAETETGAVTLTPDAEVATTNANNTGLFYYNALPAEAELIEDDKVEIVITSTYGVVTITKPVSQIAYTAYATTDGKTAYKRNADGNEVDAFDVAESFVNKLYKNGKFVTDVDFITAVMDGMHVKNDDHLTKMLNYYNEVKKTYNRETKTGTDIKLYLDPDTSGEFDLSLASIKLLQEINAGCEYDEKRISIQPCKNADHGNVPTEVVVKGAESEIPNMDLCFEDATAVTLRGDWTWKNSAIKAMHNLSALNNEGEINVTASDFDIYEDTKLMNTALGTIKVNAVSNWKIETTNYGKVYIAPNQELRVFGTTFTNDATSLQAYGSIDNQGVLGVVAGTSHPVINNYGYIKNYKGAKTYVTNNQTSSASFAKFFNQTSNKMGTIELSTATDNVSVSNATDTGFIKYTWDSAAEANGNKYVTPSKDVKYNYLIVDRDIALVDAAPEIKYIEIKASKEVVISCDPDDAFYTSRKPENKGIGFILPVGQKANIKEGNALNPSAVFLKGTLYLGGKFDYTGRYTSYLGGTSTDVNNIIKY